jgi:ADP-ribosylglycohydrolase
MVAITWTRSITTSTPIRTLATAAPSGSGPTSDAVSHIRVGATGPRCGVTHDHKEGIRGAQATAAAIFLARTGSSKEQIRQFITEQFDYFLDETLNELRPTYPFDASCQGSVPQSIIAFLESTSYEDAVRNAVSLGGDADTMACIAGAIAEAFYGGVPTVIAEPVLTLLDDHLRGVVVEFRQRFGERNRAI